MPVSVIRPFNTYGPRQSTRAIIPTIITQCLKGSTVNVGSLHPTRDFVYVAEESGPNNYTIKKVNVVVVEKYNGEALIESNPNLKPGKKIIVEGAKGISEKDIVRTK